MHDGLLSDLWSHRVARGARTVYRTVSYCWISPRPRTLTLTRTRRPAAQRQRTQPRRLGSSLMAPVGDGCGALLTLLPEHLFLSVCLAGLSATDLARLERISTHFRRRLGQLTVDGTFYHC